MNIDHLSKSILKLAWLAPWSFGCVTVLEYLFITGLSSLIEEHDENALEDACTAYFLEVQAKYFDMSERNQIELSYGLPGPPVQRGRLTYTFRLVSIVASPSRSLRNSSCYTSSLTTVGSSSFSPFRIPYSTPSDCT